MIRVRTGVAIAAAISLVTAWDLYSIGSWTISENPWALIEDIGFTLLICLPGIILSAVASRWVPQLFVAIPIWLAWSTLVAVVSTIASGPNQGDWMMISVIAFGTFAMIVNLISTLFAFLVTRLFVYVKVSKERRAYSRTE